MAVVLLIVAAAVGYASWRVSTPTMTVKLAVRASIDLDEALRALRGTRARGYRLVRDAAQATNELEVDRGGVGDSSVVVVLTDSRTRETLSRLTGVHTNDELPYTPAGVAGVVSTALHLTPAPLRFQSAEARDSRMKDLLASPQALRRSGPVGIGLESCRDRVAPLYSATAAIKDAVRLKY